MAWQVLKNPGGGQVDLTSVVRPISKFKIKKRAGSQTLTFRITDKLGTTTIEAGDVIRVLQDAVEIFEGLVRIVTQEDLGIATVKVFDVTVVDYSILLEMDIIKEAASRSVAESDKERIEWLVSTFGTKGVVAGASVQTLLASIPGGEDGVPRQDLGRQSLGKAIDQVLKLSGGQRYVDRDKELHTYIDDEGLAAPFSLQANPTDASHHQIRNLSFTTDALDTVHRVFVVGDGVTATRDLTDIGGTMPDAADVVEGIVVDNELTSEEQCEVVGDAVLTVQGANATEGSVEVLRAGLEPGQTIQITHPLYGLAAAEFFISDIDVSLTSIHNVRYQVRFGRVPPDIASVMGGTVETLGRIATTTTEIVETLTDLSTGGANLVENSSFENLDSSFWEIGAEWVFGFDPVAPQEAFERSKTARAAPAAATVGDLVTDAISVARADDYWFSAWSFMRSYTSGTAIFELREYDSADVLLQTTTIGTITAAQTDWTRHTRHMGTNDQQGRTPFHVDTAYVRLAFNTTGAATFSWDVDGVQAERGKLLTAYAPRPAELVDDSVGPTKIQDDAVITPKIAANAIVAGKIAANAVTALTIAAGEVTADKLAAILVLASLIKTAESGRRVEMDEAGIRLLDSDESLLVNIPTSGDAVYIRGEVIAASLVSESSAEFRGTVSLITGSVMTFQNAVDDPSTAPVLLASLDSLTLTSTPATPGHGIFREAAAGTYWLGADPTVGDSVAHEYNATTGALVRSIPKTGDIETFTATQGDTTKPTSTAEAWSGANWNNHGHVLTMPVAGRITKVAFWAAGYLGSASALGMVWSGSTGLELGRTGGLTLTERTFGAGNSDLYNYPLVTPVEVAAGQSLIVGFARSRSHGAFFGRRATGSHRDKDDAFPGTMVSNTTHSVGAMGAYFTYEYDVDTAVEKAKIVGVASDGSTVIAALGADGILHRYDYTDLSHLGETDLSAEIGGTKANAGLTFDGTFFVITTATGTGLNTQVRLVKVTTAGVHDSTQNMAGFVIDGSTATIRGGWYDGTTFIWVNVNGQARKYNYSTGAYVADNEFGSATSMLDGLAHDGTVFRGWVAANPTKVWKFTDWDWTTESALYWVGYSWYDSVATTHETRVGPRASITMRRRERLQVNNPAIPVGGGDDPDKVRVYMERNASEPTAGNYKLQVTDALTSRFLSTFATGGAADPTSNDFAAGNPAEIRTSIAAGSGGWSLKGDGTILMGGTEFPPGPVTNQLFYRTDRDILYFYDGTRWLSTNLFAVPITGRATPADPPYSSTETPYYGGAPHAGVYDLWLDSLEVSFFVLGGGTALGASHKWVVTLVKNPAGTTVATVNIDSGASAVWRTLSNSIGALLGTTNFAFDVVMTKTGTPGALHFVPTLLYRLVG